MPFGTYHKLPQMKLSVIIVNYNVKYFLEQSLLSVQQAAAAMERTQHWQTEIIVVDNHSADGSVAWISKRFPHIVLIANNKNVGFSAANNQGIAIAQGDYILLLNPDTLVEEDTFIKCVQTMESRPDIGALGVKMLDGKGNFLPESKRGLPTPWVAFCKLTGLSTLFPRSQFFNRYYLGHLSEHENHEIEILSGAFMLLRKTAIDKVGVLDDTFFMYGEDIDLSYRILKEGYKNYYLADTRIIHYKGESTKKGSLNYVRIFYQAMIIFAQKHLSKQQARLYVVLIKLGIYLRAMLSLLFGFVSRTWEMWIDGGILLGGLYLIKEFWEKNVKFIDNVKYAPEYMYFNVPLYIALWIASIYFSGGYDTRHQRSYRIVRGIFVGTLLISAVYGFLDMRYRSSRAMILLGAAWALLLLPLWRAVLHFVRYKNFNFDESAPPRLAIAGSISEGKRVLALLNESAVNINFLGWIISGKNDEDFSALQDEEKILGEMEQLKECAEIYQIDDIIFCARDISSQKIIENMLLLGNRYNYKIVPRDSSSIIGSNSKNSAGDLYAIDIQMLINQVQARRSKRLFDISVSVVMLLLSPLLIWIVPQWWAWLRNCRQTLIGSKTWVGYATGLNIAALPKLKPSVLSPLDALPQQHQQQLNGNTIARLNFLYAKDYSPEKDWEILLKGFCKWGNT